MSKQEYIDHALESLPKWFRQDPRAFEIASALAEMFQSVQDQGDFWKTQTYILSATEGPPSFANEHGRDRNTTKQVGETLEVFRNRIRSYPEALTKSSLLEGIQTVLDNAGVVGTPYILELPQQGARSLVHSTPGSGAAGDIVGTAPNMTYTPDTQGARAVILGDGSPRGNWHDTYLHIDLSTTPANDGYFQITGHDGDSYEYQNASGVAEASGGIVALQKRNRDGEVISGIYHNRSYFDRGYRIAGNRPVLIVILPFGCDDDIAASVQELMRQRSGAGVKTVIECDTFVAPPTFGGVSFPDNNDDWSEDMGLDLSSLWTFQEASGTILDKIGSLDLTVTGSATYQASGPNLRDSILLDDDAVNRMGTGNSTAADLGTTSFAFFLVVDVGTTAGFNTTLINNQETSSAVSNGWIIRQLTTGKLQFVAGNGSGATVISPTTVYDDGPGWAHIIFGWDAAASEFFWIDKEGLLTTSSTGFTIASSENLSFGGENLRSTNSKWAYAGLAYGADAEGIDASTFTDFLSVVPIITYPVTAAEMVSAGLPEPTHIWTMQEASGNLIDGVGSLDLIEAGTGGVTRGITAPEARDAIKFNATEGRFESPLATDADYSGQSIRIGLVVRPQVSNPLATTFMTNVNTGTNVGWWVYMYGSDGRFSFYIKDTLGNDTFLDAPDAVFLSEWTVFLAGINLDTGEVELGTTNIAATSLSTSIVGDWATPSDKMSLGTLPGYSERESDIAYSCIWTGAEAEEDFETVLNKFKETFPIE